MTQPKQILATFYSQKNDSIYSKFDQQLAAKFANSPFYTPEICELIYCYGAFDPIVHTVDYACQNGNLNLVEYLLCNDKDVYRAVVYDNMVLCLAAKYGQNHILEYLIRKYYANINKYIWHCGSDNPLCCAIENAHFHTVKFLIANGARIDTWLVKNPLRLAIKHNRLDILKYLIEYGCVQVNLLNYNNLIYFAIKYNNIEIIRYLRQFVFDE